MKKLLFISLMIIIGITSCKKEEPEPVIVYHDLIFDSNSNYDYEATINGVSYGIVPGKTLKKVNLQEGNYNVKVTQLEGYIINPSIFTFNINLTSDKYCQWP